MREGQALLYFNKSEWENHPFQNSRYMPIKDYDAGDTCNFITLFQQTSQTKLKIVPVDPEKLPAEDKDKFTHALIGLPVDGGEPRVLGWITKKPKYWSYAIGQIRKFEADTTP